MVIERAEGIVILSFFDKLRELSASESVECQSSGNVARLLTHSSKSARLVAICFGT